MRKPDSRWRDSIIESPACAIKLTTQLANCYGIIGIEDLHLKGLLKNRTLARSFSDAALGKLLALLTSKVEQRGGQVIKVGRFFPSTKLCHGCQWKWEEITLSDRVFVCQNPDCAYHEVGQDRDHNASLNILQEALRLIGLIDQVVNGSGSDDDGNLPVDLGEDQSVSAQRHLGMKQEQ